jgi:PAS domain S-box-containing protein
MRTAIVGGGKGCKSLLELVLERGLVELRLDVRIVCDLRSHAPGILYAAKRGIRTCTRLEDVLLMPGLELIIELTGDPRTADEISHRLPPGVRMMDHVLAQLFWDLIQLEARVESERQFTRKILDSIPDIVLVMDKEMRIQTVNEGFTRYTGIRRSAAYGNLCHDVLCRQENPPEDHCPMQKVLETGERVSMVQVREWRSGFEEHFEITMTPLFDEEGEISLVVESLHPIDERVRLKREVEQQVRRFQQFIDSSPDFISIKNLEGRYQVVNVATASLFDLKPEDCIGKTVHELYPAEIAHLISGHDQQVIRKGKAITYTELLTIEDREVHLNTIRFPLLDYRGDVVGVCTISRNVTKERRLQRQLVQADKLAAIGKLAAGVAHEINNPLTGILAYAEDMLEEMEGNEELRADCEVILRETLRCREIVRNLLDFAKQSEPRFRMANLNEVVEHTLALVERLATFKDVEIDQSLAGNLPPVSGDPYQLQQVVLNLLVNSAEGMGGKGKVRIVTSLAEDGRTCRISVHDNGPGIPEEAIGRIFEPFFSTKKSTHGLGLAVSWGIVERHGGRIEAENRPDGGATFRVILPVWRTEA